MCNNIVPRSEGGIYAPTTKILCLAHDKLKSHQVWATRRHFFNLVKIIVPPEEGNPSLTGIGGIDGGDIVSTQKMCVHAAGDLGLHEETQIHPRF
jgi:hypothetical protein